jgi:predicted lysophospholipase L1 biosynthesis ABC-type transport system permease subunit
MTKPEQELAEIKSMMERSTRFLSLTGLSGVMAGIFALIGAGMAYYWIYYPNPPYGFRTSTIQDTQTLTNLLLTAAAVLILSLMTGWILSSRKSQRTSSKLLTSASKRFFLALIIPLIVGGIFSLALISRGYLIIVAPATLVFYGLALVNASHFTLSDIKYLGYCELLLGIITAFFPGYGLITWTLGFGVLHVIYGTMVYYKYDR